VQNTGGLYSLISSTFKFLLIAVLDDWNKTREFEKAFLKALMPIPKEFESIPRKLIKRKKRKYSTDPRAVGNYWVIEKNGELVFRAEARLDLQGVEGIGVVQ
jgi:hypothetical protein